MRIAFVSADATPVPCSDDETSHDRGQPLAAVARELAAAGHAVDLFTRRSDLWSAPVVALAPNANVVRLPAGPPHFVPPARLGAHMSDFAARLIAACGNVDRYDVVHAVSRLSGIGTLRVRERHGIPLAVSFHGLTARRAGTGS